MRKRAASWTRRVNWASRCWTRLGCAHCYGAFEQSLRELLRRVHGSTKHEGWRYQARDPELVTRAETLRDLRDKLQRAVSGEAFETAASLRDQIRGLE